MLYLNGQFNINCDVVKGDKSLCHRALILASVANGKSVIRNLTLSRDILATINCLKALGAQIDLRGDTAIVSPILEPCNNVVLNCENSGTTARLLAGLVAGLGVKAYFVGDASLMKRPMDRVIGPLTQMGANFGKKGGCLFVSLGGKLVGKYLTAEVDSAQVKSAVLIAGLFAEGQTTYAERIATRDHTELMLKHMGADITVDGLAVTVNGCIQNGLQSLDITIPRDPSSSAFLIGAALINGKDTVCKNVLINDRRIGFLLVLQASGANMSVCNERIVCGEKVGDIIVKKSCLKPLFASKTDVCDAIDELPILAAIAAATKGKHVFESVSELQYKESNRVEAILGTVKACNQQATFDGRNLTIISDGTLPCKPRFSSYGDHRIAMAQVVLCLASHGGSVDETPFDVSFPEFCSAMGLNVCRLGLIGSDIQKSRSPKLMEHLAANANLTCSYDLISLPKESTDFELLNVVRQYDGLNVTMPFKTRIAKLLSSRFPSVNTVGKQIEPCSTDGYGIIKALNDCNIDYVGKPLWVVGAGGAAETCVETLVKYGCKIKVINRTQSHADVLAAKYRLEKEVSYPYGVLSFVPECEFEQSITLPNSCKFVFVAAYKGQSGLKEQALQKGLTYVDGLRMLYHQGAKSFSLWTNTEIQDDYDSFEKILQR